MTGDHSLILRAIHVIETDGCVELPDWQLLYVDKDEWMVGKNRPSEIWRIALTRKPMEISRSRTVFIEWEPWSGLGETSVLIDGVVSSSFKTKVELIDFELRSPPDELDLLLLDRLMEDIAGRELWRGPWKAAS